MDIALLTQSRRLVSPTKTDPVNKLIWASKLLLVVSLLNFGRHQSNSDNKCLKFSVTILINNHWNIFRFLAVSSFQKNPCTPKLVKLTSSENHLEIIEFLSSTLERA